MAIFSGPEIPNNGLVFHYDMSNTVKSWKGAPTTNVIAANFDSTFDTLADGNTAGFNNQLGTGNYLGVSSTRGYQSSKSLKINNGTGGTARVYRIYPMSLGEYSSVSAWVYSDVPGPFITIEYAGGDYNWSVAQTRNTHTGTGWELLWARANSATTSATSGHFFLYPGVNNTDTYWDNIQVEKQQYPTPYINGARSNTQTIVDLTNNNTVTASSLTYNSDGTFSFNGTTNEMHPPINHSYLSSSALEVVFRSTAHGSGKKTIFGYRHNQGYSAPTIGSLYLENNTLSASVITAAQVYRIASVASPIATNTFYHVVLNKNTSTGVLDIYVNGAIGGTQTFDAATYGQWTSAGNFIGENFLDIGKSNNTSSGQGWATDYFSGTIPLAKVYNRVLSEAEIQENFEAIRGRYGI